LQVAISLAQLAPTGELKHIFVDKAGLDILLDLLTDRAATASECVTSVLAQVVQLHQQAQSGCARVLCVRSCVL
jgi:hypothetical protein